MSHGTKNSRKLAARPAVGSGGMVRLSSDVEQREPVGFLVFCHGNRDHDYWTFSYENEARDYAADQAEAAGHPQWPIYALWATDWPNTQAQTRHD